MHRIAIRESAKGYGKYRLGAVILDRRGRVLGRGYNRPVTHPTFGNEHSGNLHAEASALISALKTGSDLSGGTCYVYRQGGNCSKPCPCCEAFLRSHGISHVYYSNNGGQTDYMEL